MSEKNLITVNIPRSLKKYCDCIGYGFYRLIHDERPKKTYQENINNDLITVQLRLSDEAFKFYNINIKTFSKKELCITALQYVAEAEPGARIKI